MLIFLCAVWPVYTVFVTWNTSVVYTALSAEKIEYEVKLLLDVLKIII